MDLKKFGKFIKELRESKGLNQEELGNIVYVHRTTVNKWEKGKALPINDTLKLLSEYFDITIDELLAGERFNKKTNNNVNNKILFELLNSKRNLTKWIKIISIFLLISIVTFLVYYFFMTYNSIYVYLVRGQNDNIKMWDGILVVSNEKAYLKLGNIYDINSFKIVDATDVTIYVIDNNEKTTLFTGDSNTLIVELDNFKEFHLDEIDKEKIYLSIDNKENNEIVELSFVRDFQNRSLFFNKDSNVGLLDDSSSNETEEILLKNNFVYDKENNFYELKNNKYNIIFYQNMNYIFIIQNNPNNKRYYIDLNEKKIYLYGYNNYNENYEKIINYGNEVTGEDNVIYNDLKDKYLDKYFPKLFE